MISIILPNLQGGGAEKVAINLANAWVSSGYQVELVLMQRTGEFINTVEKGVLIHSLNCSRIRQVPTRLFKYFRDRSPEIIVVNMWPLTSVAVISWLLAGSPGKIFLCEHVGLSYHAKFELNLPIAVVRVILRLSHARASGIVAVSSGAAKDLARLAGFPPEYVKVIYNPVVENVSVSLPRGKTIDSRRSLWRGDFGVHMLTVGNFKEVKNHRLMLQAFAKVALDFNAALVILGEGNLRAQIEQDIEDLGLSQRVFLPGFHADPSPWYSAADLFLLTSDFEGFANVIVEAMAFGVPCVSTDCPYGPAEILGNGRYGELVAVGNAEAFASGIHRALARCWEREALKRRALEFSVAKQAQAYLSFFGDSPRG